jgi:hypothetical protein
VWEIRTSVEVLLIGKDEQQCILHFAILDDAGELGSSLIDAVAVVGVNDKDEALGAYGMLAGCRDRGAWWWNWRHDRTGRGIAVPALLPRSEPRPRNIPEK